MDHVKTVTLSFQSQARRTPGAVALVDEARSFTYAELDAQSDRVAAGLARRGVRRGCCVGLHLDRSAEFVIAVLAILKSGAAYVPLATDYPASRLRLMVEDAGCEFIISGPTDTAADFGSVETLSFAELMEGSQDPTTAVCPLIGGADPAYVIFTSGSTGRPKGVVVPHPRRPRRLQRILSPPPRVRSPRGILRVLGNRKNPPQHRPLKSTHQLVLTEFTERKLRPWRVVSIQHGKVPMDSIRTSPVQSGA